MTVEPLISVDNLSVDYWNQDRWINVVRHVSFQVQPGEAVGLVGESGCGKTTTAYTLLGYAQPNSRISAGHVYFEGKDLIKLSRGRLAHIRGRDISLVPQNPTTTLSPGMHVGVQIMEVLNWHDVGSSNAERKKRMLDLLDQVRLPDPTQVARKYPHQLSGGQQQRVIIAMALACSPKLVVLDEPTTGLDVTTQAQILDLLMRLRQEHQMGMVYVSHDLSVVASICDRVGVMYAGELAEDAPTDEIFRNPRHPYTRGLIGSIPSIRHPDRKPSVLLKGFLERDLLPEGGCQFAPRCPFALDECFSDYQNLLPVDQAHRVACWRWEDIPELLKQHQAEIVPKPEAPPPTGKPLLEIDEIDLAYTYFRINLFSERQAQLVVRQTSFDIRPGETFALVGESGSGKSTIARATAGLLVPLQGQITFEGQDITRDVRARHQDLRRDIQLVFQNPDASLNPRQRVRQIIGRPLEVFYGMRGKTLNQKVIQLLEDVRLDQSYAMRYPDELSGGERQRIAIARALAANPRLMLCDEILSALDVSVQASIIDMLRELQAEYQIAYLFISHDLAVVRSLAHQVAVLYRGEVCEYGRVEDVYTPPYHPYTHMLLSSVPELDTESVLEPIVRTDPTPSAIEVQTACPFADRCPWKIGPICEEEDPPWRELHEGHAIRCHITLEDLSTLETWSEEKTRPVAN